MTIETAREGEVANVPGALDPVPWRMRYTLPLAALTVACLAAFFWWLSEL